MLPACALFALLAHSATAQTPAAVKSARGQISRPGGVGKGPVPVAGEWVVLHRVGSDRAGPLDSVRSDRRGNFFLRYRPFGAEDALYFVSARYRGIAYFSPPLRGDRVSGGDADIIVYDTTSDTTSLRLQGRHLVVGAPRGNRRELIEIFDVLNEGVRTVVARDTTAPIFTLHVPVDAESVSVAPGDIARGAVSLREGRADVFAPFSPGLRQLVLTYSLPPTAFPMSHPLERGVAVLEVLLEEPLASAEGARLVEVQPATIEGRTFHRYVAQDVPAAAVVHVAVPAAVTSHRDALRAVAAFLLVAMAAAFGVWLFRRRRVAVRVAAAPAIAERRDSVESLVAAIAELDARFERESNPSTGVRGDYERQRAELKARIARVLAGEEQRA